MAETTQENANKSLPKITKLNFATQGNVQTARFQLPDIMALKEENGPEPIVFKKTIMYSARTNGIVDMEKVKAALKAQRTNGLNIQMVNESTPHDKWDLYFGNTRLTPGTEIYVQMASNATGIIYVLGEYDVDTGQWELTQKPETVVEGDTALRMRMNLSTLLTDRGVGVTKAKQNTLTKMEKVPPCHRRCPAGLLTPLAAEPHYR